MFFKVSKLAIYLLFCSLLIIGCTSNKSNIPTTKPSDFAFSLNYGIGGKNKLDTFTNSYSRDMNSEHSQNIKLTLSEEDLNKIYSLMRTIDILNYPDNFDPEGPSESKPYDEFYITILINGNKKNITWIDNKNSQTEQAINLRELFSKIHKIVSETEEYKSLPVPEDSNIYYE